MPPHFGEARVRAYTRLIRWTVGTDREKTRARAAKKEGVNTMADLKPGMRLEGVVTNVAAFGAFVDIGVHQDGLVHVSELANTFVKDPHTVVKTGQVVQVVVLDVDAGRKRISLSMKQGGSARPAARETKAPPPNSSDSPFSVLARLR